MFIPSYLSLSQTMQAAFPSVSALYNSLIETKAVPGLQNKTVHVCVLRKYKSAIRPRHVLITVFVPRRLFFLRAGILLWQSSSGMSRHPTLTGPRGGHPIVWTVVRNFPPMWEKQVLRAIEDPRRSLHLEPRSKDLPFFSFYSPVHGMKLKSTLSHERDLSQLKAIRLMAERMGVLRFWLWWLHMQAGPESNCNQAQRTYKPENKLP